MLRNQTLQTILYITNTVHNPKYNITKGKFWQYYIFLSFKLPPTLKPSIKGYRYIETIPLSLHHL